MNDLVKRILVAIVGIPLVTGLTYLGNWYYFSLILIISLAAQNEFYQMQKRISYRPQVINGFASGIVLLLAIQTGQWYVYGAVFIALLLLIHAFEMLRHHEKASANIGVTLAGIFYIPLFLGTLILTKDYMDRLLPSFEHAGFRFIMILLVAIWICDTFAYMFGSLVGRRKLYEKVSPNKTIEGAVAGLIGATLVLSLVKTMQILPFSWPAAVTIGFTIGLLGQAGDLVESWFKREAGVKDSSTLLPGHGGMLDRFDSLIFLSPPMFILTSLFF